MKEIEKLYQILTPLQTNFWVLTKAVLVGLHIRSNVYTEILESFRFVIKKGLWCANSGQMQDLFQSALGFFLQRLWRHG